MSLRKVYLRQNAIDQTIHFEVAMPDNNYYLHCEVYNGTDNNPLPIKCIPTDKKPTGFTLRLTEAPNSFYYELHYLAIHPSIPHKPEFPAGQSGQVLSLEGDKPKWVQFPVICDGTNWHIVEPECDHKWKLYQGFTDKYEYCEYCDVKRS